MSNLPLVSIVTPSYNHNSFIEATIHSVLGQGYPNLEYIIVDGGSTDGTVDIIKKYADRIAWWVSEPDKGQTDAINKGFACAKGEIFAWLNSDDTYEPGAVQEAVALLCAQPDIGLIYGNANYIDENGAKIGLFPAAQTDYRRLRRGYVHIPQQAAFFRADLWRKIGPLDPSFYFAMDYDLWVRIAAIAPLQYTPQTWANFRLHGRGKTIIADDRCWPEMVRIHFRDGGSWFSALTAKYIIRKAIGPLWRLRLRWRMTSVKRQD
jgi:glycosyltransferase involved in cell wall biosynthesis